MSSMFSVHPSLFAMAASPDGTSPWVQFIPFILVLGIFYFIILLPMRRKQQKVQQFLESLKVGDRVITTGGIYGQITRLGGDSIQLQIADKLRIEVAKASIGGYQGQAPVVQPAEQS
jgi:preprotein translocase subunit YajC